MKAYQKWVGLGVSALLAFGLAACSSPASETVATSTAPNSVVSNAPAGSVLGSDGSQSDAETPAVDENITTEDLSRLTYIERLFDRHDSLHWHMVYYGATIDGVGPEDFTFDSYYINGDDGIVLYTEDSSGQQQQITREGVIRQLPDGTVETIDFAGDDAAVENLRALIQDPQLYRSDPKEHITNVALDDSTAVVTLEYLIEESGRKGSWEAFWGLTSGTIRFDITLDRETGDILSGTETYIDAEGTETLMYEGTITYDEEYPVPDYVSQAQPAASAAAEASSTVASA